MATQTSVAYSVSVNGNPFANGTFHLGDDHVRSEIASSVEFIAKARAISMCFRLNPKLPVFSEISESEIRLVEELYPLLATGKHIHAAPTFELRSKANPALSEAAEVSEKSLKVVSGQQKVSLFGAEFLAGPIERVFTNVVGKPNEATGEVVFSGTESTLAVISYTGKLTQ
jgi:hypothetical protein